MIFGGLMMRRVILAMCRTIVATTLVGLSLVAVSTSPAGATGSWTSASLPLAWTIAAGNASAVACAPSTTSCVAIAKFGSSWGTLVTTNLTSWTGYSDIPSAFPSGLAVNAINCPTATHCVMVGEGEGSSPVVAVSNDGGASWTDTSPTFSGISGRDVNSVDCPSATICYLAGGSEGPVAPLLASSSDGGSTWTLLNANLPTPLNYDIEGISCLSTTTCVADAVYGDLANGITTEFSTTDGGSTWTQSNSPIWQAISQVHAASCAPGTTTCWVVGGSKGATTYPVVAISNDAGATWTEREYESVTGQFQSVSCVDASNCWVGTWAMTIGLFGTSDAGSTFNSVAASTSNEITSVACASLGECVATLPGQLMTLTTGTDSGSGSGSGWVIPAQTTLGGTVTANGSPVSGVCISVDGSNGDQLSATSESDGTYALSVNATTYKVEFDPTCGGHVISAYAVQWYSNALSQTSATGVHVTSGQTVTGINAALVVEPSISGTVSHGGSPVLGVCVTALSASTGSVVGSARTATNGTYVIDLAPSSYVVQFDPTCGETNSPSIYTEQWYPNAASQNVASNVVLPAGQVVTGINAALVIQTSITGSVTRNGANASGVCVYAFSASTGNTTGHSQTQFDGTYVVDLPAGSYDVLFDPTCDGDISTNLDILFYGGAADAAGATQVTVASGQSVSSINGALVTAGEVDLTITADGSHDDSDVCVSMIDAMNLDYVTTYVTDTDGTADIQNLAPDNYYVWIDPTCFDFDSSDFSDRYLGNPATVFHVTQGATLTASQTITPSSAPAITTSSVPDGTVGTNYSFALGESGGTGPFAWSASGLPSGLTIDQNSGTLSGTPSTVGAFSATITIDDASTPPVEITKVVSGNIDPTPAPAPTVTVTTVAPVPANAPTTVTLPAPIFSAVSSSSAPSGGPAKAPVTFAVTSSPKIATVGTTVSYSLKLAPSKGSAKPTGTIVITTVITKKVKGKTTRVIEKLVSSKVSSAQPTLRLPTSKLGVGTHSVTISYSGSSKFKAASKTVTIVVKAK